MPTLTRRAFLSGGAALLAAVPAATRAVSQAGTRGDAPAARTVAGGPHRADSRPDLAGLGMADPAGEIRGLSSVGMERRYGPPPAASPASLAVDGEGIDWKGVRDYLQTSFPDLHRHFIFEYYPWYGNDPWRHWNKWGRVPPNDVGATSYPLLGPYDSRDAAAVEQHARWIAETGAGAVNLSWWGRGGFADLATHRVMDVMADHDIKVTFHLEPYANDRGRRYARDIRYLLRRYGDRRGWDCFLVLRNADGREGPVFKSFRTILPQQVTDCHGQTQEVPDFTPDRVWRRQTRRVRTALRDQFDHVTLLADSLDSERVEAGGFDGIAIYDAFVEPTSWAEHAAAAAARDLSFSFNCNPGYDEIHRREVPAGSCYSPNPFHPPAEIDWDDPGDRNRARRLSRKQIIQTLRSTLTVQTDPSLSNFRNGFFLVYMNSFNEWHEGTQFEPMKDWDDLTDGERRWGYHNPRRGNYRLETLRKNLHKVLG